MAANRSPRTPAGAGATPARNRTAKSSLAAVEVAVAGMTLPNGTKKAKPAAVVRTAKGLCINGVRGSALVGKFPAVQAQPAPGEPRHFTREEISAAVARHMKLA